MQHYKQRIISNLSIAVPLSEGELLKSERLEQATRLFSALSLLMHGKITPDEYIQRAEAVLGPALIDNYLDEVTFNLENHGRFY
ncbi:MAG: hypothetical protein AAFO04_24025 [Cyanobacteria bacterium J06592_8]